MNDSQHIVRREGQLVHVTHNQFNGTLELRDNTFGLQLAYGRRVGEHMGMFPDAESTATAEAVAAVEVGFKNPPEEFVPLNWTSRKLLLALEKEVKQHWNSFREED
jgi:hypothetical protein